MNRELLETPFRPDQIKQRKGNFGNTLAYVEAHTVIQRLNDAFDAAWSFEILSHQVLQDEVLVLGKLTAGNISKTQFGSSTITRSKSTGDIISLGDDLKAAATDSLKKTATLLGVGIALYGGGQNPQQQQNYPAQPHAGYSPGPGPNIGYPPSAGQGFSPNANTGFSPGPNTGRPYNNGAQAQGQGQNQPSLNGQPLDQTHTQNPNQPQAGFNAQNQAQPQTNNRLSSKQLSYLHGIAKDKAITRQELNQMAVQRFNTQVEFLNKKDASMLIEELTNTNTNPRQYAENAA